LSASIVVNLYPTTAIGTHLLAAKDDQIRSIAVSLRDDWGVRYLAPVHMDAEDLRSYRAAMVRGPLRAIFGRDKHLARAQQ
jgi:hypothetical protein